MKGELVVIQADDGLLLHGLFCAPKSPKTRCAVVHVHGLASSFYETKFVSVIGDEILNKGYYYLTASNRGQSYTSDFRKKTNHKDLSVQIGSSYEIFEECIYDINGYLKFLEKRGINNVILQGHSTGALKITYYQSKIQNERIKSIILMSPSDDIGIQKGSLSERYDEALQLAEKMVKENNERGFMPPWCYEYPISARTYLDMFGAETKIGIFPYHQKDVAFSDLARVKCPIFASFGSEDYAVVKKEVDKAIVILKQKAKSCSLIDTAIIRGADHNYRGHEKEIAKLIGIWVSKIMLPEHIHD